MKNLSMNNSGLALKNVFMAVAFVCAFMVSTLPSYAYNDEKKAAKVAPVEVKYLGQIDRQPVFQVDINNAKEDQLTVILKDGYGNFLYSEKFKEKSFSKKFQIASGDLGDLKLTMVLASKGNKNVQSFEINNVVTVVEDVVVTKVD
jgi:hypothetical protein